MKPIIQFLPIKAQAIIDYQEIAYAIETYASTIKTKTTEMKNNLDIFKMSEKKIIEYEKMLDITPSAQATLDERRYDIYIKSITKLPYSEQWLRHYLTNLLGENKYKLVMNYNNYSMQLKITLSSDRKINDINKLLDTIIPAHINYVISRLYNEWNTIAKYKWNEIANYTWQYVAESEDL